MSAADIIMMVRDVLLLVILGVALYTDLTRGKVYNWLTVPAIFLGLILNFLLDTGIDQGRLATSGPLLGSVAGIAIALVIFGFAYLMHMIGGGDVKLLMVVGAFMQWRFFLSDALVIACIGAVIAVVVLAVRGRLLQGLRSSALALVMPWRVKKRLAETPPGSPEVTTIPYTIAIAAGTVCTWLLTPGNAALWR